MAAGDLTFGSFTICTASAGDRHNRINSGFRGSLSTVDIVFPNTAGKEIRVIGNQNTPETSLTISYGASPRGDCCIYKANGSTMETFLESVRTFMLTESNLIGTLTDKDTNYTGMRWTGWDVSPIMYVNKDNSDVVYVTFAAVFTRYTV